jgi:hypothetical protein
MLRRIADMFNVRRAELGNNGMDYLYTHLWSRAEYKDGSLLAYESARHGLSVVQCDNKYRIAKDGMHLRGRSGRVRIFGSATAAMFAADKEG